MTWPTIRNHISHSYNLYGPIKLPRLNRFLYELKRIGVSEIELAGRKLQSPTQIQRSKAVISLIHDHDMRAILYTGVFGTENIMMQPALHNYTQKNKEGRTLTYGRDQKTAMMCPQSPYVQHILYEQLQETIQRDEYDCIYMDIPWILQGGCYCKHCTGFNSNEEKVRTSLEQLINALKNARPNINISVNASAPLINKNNESGGHIDNLTGIFDAYVTEWNPYRWRQPIHVLKPCLQYAKEKTRQPQYHATTCTNRKGELYTKEELINLFATIVNKEASLRLGVALGNEKIRTIGDAWKEVTYK